MSHQSAQAFAKLCGLIKNVKRAGWLRYLPADKVQSVGDHSCRIAMLTMALRGIKNIDQRKCLEMALIHDIGEGIVGDITPHDKVTPQQKFEKEFAAVKSIFEQLGEQNKDYYLKLWLQYEDALSYQALVVKDLDKYQMIQQAFQYQQKYDVDLSQFYECVVKMKTQQIKKWADELIEERKKFLLTKQKK